MLQHFHQTSPEYVVLFKVTPYTEIFFCVKIYIYDRITRTFSKYLYMHTRTLRPRIIKVFIGSKRDMQRLEPIKTLITP